LVHIARRTSEADADRSIRELKQLGIQWIDADWDIAHEAGRFKAKQNVFCRLLRGGAGETTKGTPCDGDREFKQVEKDVIINWLK
jgi:hypothetical protein